MPPQSRHFIAVEAGQIRQAITGKKRMEAALVTGRPEDNTRLCGEAGEPLHLGQVAELVGQCDDTMANAPIRKIRRAEPFEVIGAGVKSEGDAPDPTDDHLLLLGTHMMD